MKFGKIQKHYLREMLVNGRVIRVVRDYRDMREDASIQDEEGENDYETVNKRVLQSLCDKKILSVTDFLPSLQIEVFTFRVKEKFKNELMEKIQ